jgi:syntaxin 12/13
MSSHTAERRNQLLCLSPCSHEDWNQMQSQEDEAAITEQDLELIKERETAIRQLEVRARSCLLLTQCL